jgi:hypothetical protein
VPTGINAGVLITPCGVLIWPVRPNFPAKLFLTVKPNPVPIGAVNHHQGKGKKLKITFSMLIDAHDHPLSG